MIAEFRPRSARSWTRDQLGRDFYARAVLKVARDCIGKVLVHDGPGGLTAGRIVEAEAYRGPEDRAAHSWNGRRTARTEVMYGPPGHSYVFFIYGMHHNFNLVTGRAGQPHAVLIRGIEPLQGLELMARRRSLAPDRRELSNGPGKLCQALGITLEHYGADLCAGPLFLADAPRVVVGRSPRVGIDYAGSWADKPWRFFERGNRYVSRAPRARLGRP